MAQLVIPALTKALGGTFLAKAFSTVVYYGAVTAISSYAIQALTDQALGANAQAGQLINAREPTAPQEYVYGQVRKGGKITFMEGTGTDNKYLHVVITLAGHECEELGDVYVNDEVVTIDGSNFVTGDRWNSKIRICKHDGSQTTSDPDLVSETSVTSTFVGNGIAYIYVRLEHNSDVFSGGVPTFTVVVKGRKILDPRTSTTAYSANAALVIRDYITDSRGLEDANVNDTYLQTAANDSDDAIALAAGGAEPRYEINGVISSQNPIGQNLQSMVNACNGSLFISGGEWHLKVGVYSSSIKSFTRDDIWSGIDIEPRHSHRDNFNSVTGTFSHGGKEVDGGGDWVQTDYPPIESTAFLAEDNGVENILDLPLPLVTSPNQAQRVAKQFLFRSREQITFTAEFSPKAMNVTVGDVVDLSISEFGWTSKEFEVANWIFKIDPKSGARVEMTLREASSTAFDWDAEESEVITNNSELLAYYEAPDVGVSLAAVGHIRSEKLLNSMEVTVTSTLADFVDLVEVEYKKSTDSEYILMGIGQLGKFEALDLDRADYDVRARSINPFGVKGAWEEYTDFSVDATAGPPADVNNFSFEVVGNQLNLFWDAVGDLDLSHYRIRHAMVESGASWGGATTVVPKVPRPGVNASLPLRSGTYMIRAYDKGGIPSENWTEVVVPSTYLPSYATTNTQTEETSFSGTKTGVSVVSNALRLTSPVSADDSGTYEFSTYIDTGSVQLVWARIEATLNRLNDTSALFDDLPGNFDELSGLFDSLSGGDFDDFKVLFEIATTDDDPSGSPTWSSWQLFRAGNFSGRAFKFRVTMSTETDDITPNLTALAAIVEY